MVILHIASIEPSVLGGVNVAVPQMVQAQNQYATVGLVNLTCKEIPSLTVGTWEELSEGQLKAPFDKPDLVVFHEVYRPRFLKLYPLLLKKGIPYLVIPHGCLTKTAQKKKALKKVVANLLLFRRFLKNAHSIWYLSERERKQSVFSFPSYVAGNGISLPEVQKEAVLSDAVRLVYIGRPDWKIKGLDLLLKAVKAEQNFLKKRQVTLAIYCSHDNRVYQKMTRFVHENNLSQLVTFPGEIRGKEKENVLLFADYFIQTSRTEGMPMGLLEALSYGLPAIVTEGTGFSETLRKNNAGYGCETSVNGIRGAIREAVSGRDSYPLLSQNARTLASNEFDRSRIAEHTVEEYGKIVMSSNGERKKLCF